jgi:hypothetical protein
MANVTELVQEAYTPNQERSREVIGCYNFDANKFRLFSRASGAPGGTGKKQVLEFDEAHARELYQKLAEFLAQ